MVKPKWKRRVTGTKRQRGKSFVLSPSSQKLKSQLPGSKLEIVLKGEISRRDKILREKGIVTGSTIIGRKVIYGNGTKGKSIPIKVSASQMNAAIKVEMEHTKDPVIAKKIAIDHFNENIDYYKKLAKMEATFPKKGKEYVFKGVARNSKDGRRMLKSGYIPIPEGVFDCEVDVFKRSFKNHSKEGSRLETNYDAWRFARDDIFYSRMGFKSKT